MYVQDSKWDTWGRIEKGAFVLLVATSLRYAVIKSNEPIVTLKNIEGYLGLPSTLDRLYLTTSTTCFLGTVHFIGIGLGDNSWGSDVLWWSVACKYFIENYCGAMCCLAEFFECGRMM